MQSSELLIQPTYTSSSRWLSYMPWSQKYALSLFFGCVLGLSSPGFDVWPIAWFGLVPLLVLLRGAANRTDATITGAVFGLGYYLVSLSWYLGLFPMTWLGLQDWLSMQAVLSVWVLESLHECLLFAGFAWLVYSLPMRAGFIPYIQRPYFPFVLSVPLIWVFFQWAIGTSEMFLGIPVNQLAYSQVRHIDFIQIARFGGSGLIDYILVLSNTVLAQCLLEMTGVARAFEDRLDRISEKTGVLVDAAAVSVVVFGIVLWGSFQVKDATIRTRLDNEESFNKQSPTVPVAICQGNVSIEEERLKTSSPSDIARRYAAIDKNHGAMLVVLPEGLINNAQRSPGLLLSQLKDIAYGEKKEVIVGSVESLEMGKVNAARIISPSNPKESLYIKHRLVPFGEFAPLGQLGRNISDELDGKLLGSRESFVASQATQVLKSMWGGVGVSICVEVIYPHLISNEVRHGANLLVNISNLGWFHNSSLNKQVLAAAIMRAVENGRYLVLSTNTGTSAVVDPSGVVTSMSYRGQRGVVLDTVQFLYGETPFSKMWWL